ncbi:unnamed protein product [Bacillus thuringiensis DB27]|uniref:Uncharacterized protein n=1 Tax=Bacillus thuringiensis DB27 TaxID=1431339 RepID=W8ZBA5_BACTU|nr:unnamed protein product [Bacillus thuringiensis DB27]
MTILLFFKNSYKLIDIEFHFWYKYLAISKYIHKKTKPHHLVFNWLKVWRLDQLKTPKDRVLIHTKSIFDFL